MANQILAVVVTFNRYELMKECIARLEQSEGALFDILVVDNGSLDGTSAWLREQEAHGVLKVLRLEQNIGGAGGFHTGVRYGIEHGYQRIWMLDDDTFVNPDSLKELVDADHILNGHFGFLCSAVLWKDGHDCKMNRVRLQKSYYTELDKLRYGLIPAMHATFVSFYLNTDAAIEVGLPIKEYFIWGDDIEYSMRLSHRYPCYLSGRSQVMHWMKENVGSSIANDEADHLDRYKYAFRNDGCTYRKYGFSGICYYAGKCVVNIGRIIVHARDHRLKRIGIVLGGIVRSWFFHPVIAYAKPLDQETLE